MRNIFRIVLIVTISILLIACSDNTNENDTTKIDEEETIEVLHELDHDPVIVPKNPERVVVFDIGALDTLSFLGEEQRVVCLPQATVPNYLSEFASDEYENFGSLKEPEFEKIHAAQPDLIIISGRQMELYEQFREIAPTIYLDIDTHNYVNSFEQNARLLGEIFDKEDEIEAELETIQEKINAIKENVQSVDESALIVLGTEGKVSAYGPASRFGIIHDVFGIKPADPNIEESTHGQSKIGRASCRERV